MRIGELAALAGVTTRTVRHYHRLGVLPEPGRLANGYREYGIRHAVALARVRRLTGLGMGLAEVREVLADEAGVELVEILGELDADLARQEAVIAGRRARLGELMRQAREGRLPAEGPVSPELYGLLGAVGAGDSGDSGVAAKDRSHLALLDTVLGEDDRERFFGALRPFADDEALAGRVHGLYERLDALADAEPDDPRVGPLGDELAAVVPEELVRLMGEQRLPLGDSFGKALLADFTPAQAATVRHMVAKIAARARAGARAGAGRDEGAA
ncbi:MerR family transcriptional regulator [Streptomyces inusitatus]|uniref:MerR family transcriptional regulator n=1 Tax=Streptomyces inusitatus TaxID=68221 RepID=A0A918PT74_9ACTN|nr:MerR family transcriptional regulator [Streptomyces inusitatus]GGZ21888.1 MerR family transcriptional regulator [Streptomyces inusitatus]